MRKKIVAGNWKMNLDKAEANHLINDLKGKHVEGVSLAVFAPALHIDACSQLEGFGVGVQNIYKEQKGAYTGEISASQAKSYGCQGTLIGHSERRSIFGESNALLKDKVNAALAEGLHVMFCIGETLEQREAGQAEQIVEQQLNESVFHLTAEEFKNIHLAYEPVWAIGTGVAATPEQAQDIHAHIRSLVNNKYGEELANETSILYGGSVKPANAKEIFSKADIDGGLIGGASLKAEDFLAIANSFEA